MLFTSDAATHAEQHNKIFIILALVDLQPELDFALNKMLSRSLVLTYDTISEQPLHLSTPLSLLPIPLLGSHSYHRGGQRRGTC